MASGRDMQITRQIGEHLVVAELGRRGYVAAPFAGNVPMFDLLGADMEGFAFPVQVKAIRGPSWQFRVDTFLRIEIVDGEQLEPKRRQYREWLPITHAMGGIQNSRSQECAEKISRRGNHRVSLS